MPRRSWCVLSALLAACLGQPAPLDANDDPGDPGPGDDDDGPPYLLTGPTSVEVGSCTAFELSRAAGGAADEPGLFASAGLLAADGRCRQPLTTLPLPALATSGTFYYLAPPEAGPVTLMARDAVTTAAESP